MRVGMREEREDRSRTFLPGYTTQGLLRRPRLRVVTRWDLGTDKDTGKT